MTEWLAHQPWCTGTVGMMGINWRTFNALQVAVLRPDPLKAIITLCSTVDRPGNDINDKGGYLLNENPGWRASMWAGPVPAVHPIQNCARIGARCDWIGWNSNRFCPLSGCTISAGMPVGSMDWCVEDFGALPGADARYWRPGDAYKNAVPRIVEQLIAPDSTGQGIVGLRVHKYPHSRCPNRGIGFLQ